MALYIVEDECISCGDCVPECPTDSISESLVAFKISEKSCTECEGEADSPKCVDICPIDDCILPVA
ncbi:4Fe-4S binding protein [Motiliproteus sp. SC1-56]|uniref:4Fe-4S binding protein n=1 Tax=Motiliproteus sp. SC1-56 TaxID=2799565 RepID=UPI001A8D2FB7|nr:4Fe-4S binding protein [Motiliproteus sp. SC1-56]